MFIENETIGDGSGADSTFKNCKFKTFDPSSYVNCTFIGCTFPDNPELGKKIFDTRSINKYSSCTFNMNTLLKDILEISNGVPDIINSINSILNQKANKNESHQVADIGKTKKGGQSKLAII